MKNLLLIIGIVLVSSCNQPREICTDDFPPFDTYIKKEYVHDWWGINHALIYKTDCGIKAYPVRAWVWEFFPNEQDKDNPKYNYLHNTH